MKQELQTTCPFCSLHCADLRLTIDGGRLTHFSPPCRLGRSRYVEALAAAAAAEHGNKSSTSLRSAQRRLQTAGRLLVILSQDIPDEAVAGSLILAQKYGALLAVEYESGSLLSRAMKTAGYLTGTLGELHDAQAALFCGVDPRHTHPRLGDFISKQAQANALSLNTPDPFEAVRWLRLGLAAPDQAVPQKLNPILELTRTASTGVVFFGPQWLQAWQPLADELLLWLRDLNRRGRWYAQYLSPGANACGVTEALLASAGYALSLRFDTPASITPLPHLQASMLLESGCSDVCLLVGQPHSFSDHTFAYLRKIKTILLDPQPPAWKKALWMPTAQVGIEASGSMQRLDGLPLHLEPILQSNRPSIQSLLAGLTRELPS